MDLGLTSEAGALPHSIAHLMKDALGAAICGKGCLVFAEPFEQPRFGNQGDRETPPVPHCLERRVSTPEGVPRGVKSSQIRVQLSLSQSSLRHPALVTGSLSCGLCLSLNAEGTLEAMSPEIDGLSDASKCLCLDATVGGLLCQSQCDLAVALRVIESFGAVTDPGLQVAEIAPDLGLDRPV